MTRKEVLDIVRNTWPQFYANRIEVKWHGNGKSAWLLRFPFIGVEEGNFIEVVFKPSGKASENEAALRKIIKAKCREALTGGKA